jgi:hypothetical protein
MGRLYLVFVKDMESVGPHRKLDRSGRSLSTVPVTSWTLEPALRWTPGRLTGTTVIALARSQKGEGKVSLRIRTQPAYELQYCARPAGRTAVVAQG